MNMPPAKRNFSAWTKMEKRLIEPLYPAPAVGSPWAGMKNVPGAQELAESQGYAARLPQQAPDMTLTGDMAASSPKQQAAAAQFEANMRASEAARVPQTDEQFREQQFLKKLEDEKRRVAEGRLY